MYSLIALIISLSPAHATSACLETFSNNLSGITYSVGTLSKVCWKEVQKGEGNLKRIMDSCTDSELSHAAAIRDHRDANRELCSSDCRSELKAAGLCVGGKSLQYYVDRVRSR